MMNDETEYLDIVSIFHFVVAGFTALVACFPVFHLVLGISMLVEFPRVTSQNDYFLFPFLILPVMFVILPSVIILLG